MSNGSENHKLGRFEGEVLARLKNIDHQQSVQWKKLDEMSDDIGTIEKTLAKRQGFSRGFLTSVFAVSSFLSAIVAFAVSWKIKE